MTDQDPFRAMVRAEGASRYRDLPWRRTRDPYAIWISEVMLQQTQVARVEQRWGAWLERFPAVSALARAPQAEVLAAWQGLGYNRRALALKAAAEEMQRTYAGEVPQGAEQLMALPGIGPATAQGIRAFAFDLPGVYLETNVRTVFLHHCFPDVPGVPDKELVPLVRAACPAAGDGSSGYAVPQDAEDTPRSWYYALLDYGAYLKKTVPNPSRRSSGYARQSAFEGSRRQKRAELVRVLLGTRESHPAGLSLGELCAALDAVEVAAGRGPLEREQVRSILDDLGHEGFCTVEDGRWRIV